jgi:pre-rRNA-processing protein IPI1
VLDLEAKVRRTALAILEAVLGHAEWGSLEPLYEVLAAHLSCALTHILPAIQRDGLRFIDALSQVGS